MATFKIYVPAGNWVVENITEFCALNNIGNAEITGIGSLTNIWVLLNPDGKLRVRNFGGMSYEMTSLLGNVVLRQGIAGFDKSALPSGMYPQFDTSVQTLNPYVHLHVTFANPDFSISGGHLLDTQVSIGVEAVVRTMAGADCVPGFLLGNIPAGCIYSTPVEDEPYGVFSNWDERFWYPPPPSDEGAK
ncbi:MAG TPA: PPC domain-containing DNA-binding protein [Chloroflexia bacterium]|jgi:predicted DNA-binding protein with PD1-like motif